MGDILSHLVAHGRNNIFSGSNFVMARWYELSHLPIPELITGSLGEFTSFEVEWLWGSNHHVHDRITFSKLNHSE